MRLNSLKLHGFTFTPLATAAAIAAALAWFDDETVVKTVSKTPSVNGHSFHSLGNFAGFNAEGKMPNYYHGYEEGRYPFQFLNQACHYWLSCIDNHAQNVDVVAFWTDTERHSEHYKYFEWLAKESFASEFILAVHKKGIVVSADIPADLMHCIAMFSRVARMFPKEHFVQFNKLREKGIPGEVAFLTCFCVGKYSTLNVAFTPSSDHRPFQCPNLKGMKDFLQGKFQRISSNPYRFHRSMNCSHYLGGGGTFRGTRFDDDITSNPELVSLILESRKANGEGAYRPPNPFAKQEQGLRPGQYSYEEIYEIVLPYYNAKGEFNV